MVLWLMLQQSGSGFITEHLFPLPVLRRYKLFKGLIGFLSYCISFAAMAWLYVKLAQHQISLLALSMTLSFNRLLLCMQLAAIQKTMLLGSASSSDEVPFRNSEGMVISPDDQSMARLTCLSQGNPSIMSSGPKLVTRKSCFLSWSPMHK